MFRKHLGLVTAGTAALMLLTACGGGDSDASGSSDGVQKAAGGQGGFATSVTLIHDKNFAENGSSGLKGVGCKNVKFDNAASSLQAQGSIIIWTGANCTGTSKKVQGNILDLGTIGFDNKISSVFFGPKAEQPAAGGSSSPTGGVKTGSAVLLDDPNDQSENNVARGVSGTGCKNVPAPGSASAIVHMSGPARVWAKADCQGEVRVINSNTLDLGTIGFDNKIASIRFI
ncbi:hypothetical protein ACIOKD_41870 [Streptomyces sp. NPDC087844]|uniref:hypothetical protein n=1 Tax=Streptomyces sp. NPDC087844 TaxID=3365805 RepID=UPI00380BEB76